jgi:hypothetical protein
MINLINTIKESIQKKIVPPRRRPWTPALLVFSALLSIAPPAVFLALHKPAGEKQTGAGYAMLVLDEEQDEREIRELLEKHNIKNYRSESTEWFLLNDFTGIQKIPLDEYPGRLEQYDPRNDGYAEKARAIFVRDGKRRIFIPARELGGFGSAPEEKIRSALEGRRYSSIHFQSVRRSNTANTIIFIIAALFLVLAAWKISVANKEPYQVFYAAFFVPSLALLAGLGAAGFALAALSLGFFEILRKPLLNFLVRGRYKRKTPVKFDAASIYELFQFDQFKLLLGEIAPEKHKIIPLAALFFGICIAGGIPALTALCFVLFFSLSFVSMLATEALRGKLSRHIPFTFIPIRSASCQKAKYPTLPVPFLAALVIQIIVSPFTGAGAALSRDFPDFPGLDKKTALPSESDWERHVETQRNFNVRNLNTASGDTQNYLHYKLGEDGLIQNTEIDRSITPEEAPMAPCIKTAHITAKAGIKAPVAPLGGLVAFIQGAGETDSPALRPASGAAANRPGSLFAGFFALCLYLPFVFQRSFQRHRKRLPCLLLYNE